MDRSEIVTKLKGLIEEQDDVKIESSDQKLDIDSYTMMLVITFVQEEMGIQLDMDQLDFDAFQSLDAFTDMIQQQSEAA